MRMMMKNDSNNIIINLIYVSIFMPQAAVSIPLKSFGNDGRERDSFSKVSNKVKSQKDKYGVFNWWGRQ